MLVQNADSKLFVRRGFENIRLLLSPVLMALLLAAPLVAQDDEKKKKEPKPEPLTLTTKDGVILECTWYPGTQGKESVPVILLHDWDGQKGDYRRLGQGLQKLGFSVIAPDLRGHGQSTRFRSDDGDDDAIDRTKMNRGQIALIGNDIEACKRFLMKQNNAGKLNIEKLCVIGAGVSALLAMEYAVYDWNVPQLPNYKQGQDVKALLLLSPKNSYKGLTNRNALMHPVVRSKLSVMIIVGEQNSRAVSDAKRLHTRFERYHDPIPKTREERKKKQDLFFVEIDTKLQGTKLLQASGLRRNPYQFILTFLKYRLQDKEIPWAERKNPLSD